MSSPFTTSQSRSLLEQHQSLLTCGYVSHKSLPEMAEKGYPVFVDRAKGARFWDVDGNEYLDFLMGYGPIVLGYDDPAICEAVRQQMAIGTIFTTAYRKELDVAEKLIELIPSAEMVGYFIGGSAATSGAVRLSRAYTNRAKVIKSGYHGWHDWTRPEDPGVPQAVSDLTLVAPYGDLNALESIFKANDNQVACLILETIQDTGPPEGYLQACVDLATAHGALCVFDETKVGFRIAFGGAGEHFGVTPDISTFGKACCNGYPGTFITGKKAILDSDACRSVWMTGTAHGHPLSLAATETVIKELKRRDGIAYQWQIGNRLIEGVNKVCEAGGLSFRLVGPGPMPRPRCDESDREKCLDMLRGCLARGVYLHPTHPMFLSLSHTLDDIDSTIKAVGDSVGELDLGG